MSIEDYRERVAKELSELAEDVRDGTALVEEIRIEYQNASLLSRRPIPTCTATGRSAKNMQFSIEFKD